MIVSKSKIFFLSCSFFILGISLGYFFTLDKFVLYLIILGLIAGLTFIWDKIKLRLLFLGGIFLFLGLEIFSLHTPIITDELIQFYNEKGAVNFQGVVSEEPDIRFDHTKLTIKSRYLAQGNFLKPVKGKVLIKTDLYPEYQYGDLLNITCRLQSPEPIEDFRYDHYLARYNIYSLCYNPKIELLDNNQGNFLMAGVLKIKNKFVRLINKMFPEPQASFLGGLLYGARRGIPQDLMGQFNRTGITHIIAISGYNITILAVISQSLLQGIYVSRKKAFWLTVLLIIFFVVITGAPASVTRAAIMGVLVLLARQTGRVSKVGNVLIFAAALMLVFSPRVLFYDAGWQLSFVATLGLVYLSPIIELYFKKVPEFFNIKESFISTMSAIILTLPLILYNFGRLSIVAPIVNILVLPVIPLTMAIGFVSVISGFVWLGLGKVIGWGAWLLLNYIISVVGIFSNLSWASIEISNFSFVWLIVFYLIIAVWIILGQTKLKKQKIKV